MVHVVIADDDYTIRYLVQRIVSILGWTSDTAASGVEALEQVNRLVPDLVICDVRMPKLSGVDLLRIVKNDPRLAKIPVVLMSSLDLEEEARASGCDAFLSKPFTADTLLDLLPKLVPNEAPC